MENTTAGEALVVCTVEGIIAPGAMCGAVITGAKYCGLKGECVFQKPERVTAAPATALHPMGSMGEAL